MPDPQEISQEESKLGNEFVAKVNSASQQFMDDKMAFEVQCDKDVTNLSSKRAALIEQQEHLGRFATTCGNGLKTAIDQLSAESSQVKKQF